VFVSEAFDKDRFADGVPSLFRISLVCCFRMGYPLFDGRISVSSPENMSPPGRRLASCCYIDSILCARTPASPTQSSRRPPLLTAFTFQRCIPLVPFNEDPVAPELLLLIFSRRKKEDLPASPPRVSIHSGAFAVFPPGALKSFFGNRVPAAASQIASRPSLFCVPFPADIGTSLPLYR